MCIIPHIIKHLSLIPWGHIDVLKSDLPETDPINLQSSSKVNQIRPGRDVAKRRVYFSR